MPSGWNSTMTARPGCPVARRSAAEWFPVPPGVVTTFGVVTINTKATRTAIWVGEYGMTVGGKKVDYLRKSRAEARRARRLLARAAQFDVPVQAAIVFTGARRFSVRRGGPPDVAVLGSPRALRRWLRKQPALLADRQVAAIYQAARKPVTWQGQGNSRI